MRVRPFFWFVLFLSCTSVLVFAATRQTQIPANLQISGIPHHLLARATTTLHVRVTDQQGIPVENAHVFSEAHMTNMVMAASRSQSSVLGKGQYVVQVGLSMAGPWSVTIHAYAEGFVPLQETLLMHVKDDS